MEAVVEEKFGKLWNAVTALRGDHKSLKEIVQGNGLPGHEQRIKDVEDHIKNRRETCPVLKESADKKGQNYIIIGLVINGLIMLTGFVMLYLTA